MEQQEDIEVVDPVLRDCITADQAWHYKIIPISRNSDGVSFVTCNDLDQALEQELELLLGVDVNLEAAPKEQVNRLLASSYRRSDSGNKKIEISANSAQHVIQDLVLEAKSLGSSDIHIEVYEEMARVRIRIDGALVERYRYDKKDHASLVNRVKVQASLDISEKRLPQDGRMMLNHEQERSDVRVSILPTLHGEKVVLRILGQDAGELDIRQLGMDSAEQRAYLQGVSKPHGIILISGPTGSGKTTTLYATLKHLNETVRNIVTIEDPVEYTLEGINQVQMKGTIGLDFAAALKSFLRQDPDVIMLGEIRDAETAQMAIRASLTGHLVLSTIHTNSAWGTISRLIDMGVPPFLLSSTLNVSVAQRLVRLLCNNCKTPNANDTGGKFTAVGCPTCHYTGYKGRRALYEVIPITRAASKMIHDGITDQAEAQEKLKFRTLASSANELIEQGLSSYEEVLPIITSR